MQFRIIAKEKELIQSYNEKCDFLKESLEREKAAWLMENSRQQKIFDEETRQKMHSQPASHPKPTDSDNVICF
jgi:hypothetical protein